MIRCAKRTRSRPGCGSGAASGSTAIWNADGSDGGSTSRMFLGTSQVSALGQDRRCQRRSSRLPRSAPGPLLVCDRCHSCSARRSPGWPAAARSHARRLAHVGRSHRPGEVRRSRSRLRQRSRPFLDLSSRLAFTPRRSVEIGPSRPDRAAPPSVSPSLRWRTEVAIPSSATSHADIVITGPRSACIVEAETRLATSRPLSVRIAKHGTSDSARHPPPRGHSGDSRLGRSPELAQRLPLSARAASRPSQLVAIRAVSDRAPLKPRAAADRRVAPRSNGTRGLLHVADAVQACRGYYARPIRERQC